ncbi:MAG: DUF1559 domain-containing protein [Planctomycetales bacterium]|nr:DUF1559 domain-containing protein [Planctomycetales bacterium]
MSIDSAATTSLAGSRCVRLLTIALICAVLAPQSGCDSRASQMEELKRQAMRRSSSDDEEEETPAPAAKKDSAEEPSTPETQKPEPAAAPAEEPSKHLPAEPKPELPPRKRPESDLERRAWALTSLNEISAALSEYLDEKGLVMPAAIRDGAGVPLLSWRVALLPYLGHQELYDKFDLSQPWDSRKNLALLAEIPDVYRNAERMDEKTNFLVPFGRTTMYTPNFDQILGQRIEDGLNNTIAVLEVDDDLAVEWTRPQDYDADKEPRGIGTKRKDGIFVAFADSTVRRIPSTVKPSEFQALLTRDGGEPVTMAKVSFAVAADPTRATDVDNKPYEQLATLGGVGAAAATSMDANNPNAIAEQPEAPDERPPAPPETSLADSRRLFREIYGPKHAAATTSDKKLELAQELLDKSRTMSEDVNGRYVVLQAARVIAGQARDVQVGLEIIKLLTQHYRLDDQPLKVELLLAVGADLPSSQIEAAMEVIQVAVKRGDFESASTLVRHAVSADRETHRNQKGKADENEELIALKRRVEVGRSEYRKFRQELAEVVEGSPESLTIVGRYFCFVKEDWLQGLTMLSNCDDEELRDIARLELQDLPSPEQRLEIAEAWWKYGTSQLRHRDTVWRHATLWFAAAESSLPDGLLRIKAEARLAEISRELGDEVVQEIKGKLLSATQLRQE